MAKKAISDRFFWAWAWASPLAWSRWRHIGLFSTKQGRSVTFWGHVGIILAPSCTIFRVVLGIFRPKDDFEGFDQKKMCDTVTSSLKRTLRAVDPWISSVFGHSWTCLPGFWTVLDRFLAPFGRFTDRFWHVFDHFGTEIWSFWGYRWDRFVIVVASFWGRFGAFFHPLRRFFCVPFFKRFFLRIFIKDWIGFEWFYGYLWPFWPFLGPYRAIFDQKWDQNRVTSGEILDHFWVT